MLGFSLPIYGIHFYTLYHNVIPHISHFFPLFTTISIYWRGSCSCVSTLYAFIAWNMTECHVPPNPLFSSVSLAWAACETPIHKFDKLSCPHPSELPIIDFFYAWQIVMENIWICHFFFVSLRVGGRESIFEFHWEWWWQIVMKKKWNNAWIFGINVVY